MDWPKRYDPQEVEERLARRWEEQGVYHFDPAATGRVYSIDTPPPSISGHLHLGHVYSYSHTDFVARYRRMRGENVFYPMGFDDNGLPTERLAERRLGRRAAEIGRAAFIEQCLAISREMVVEYRELWERLGLSIDWRYSYDTIDENSRRAAQSAFINLYRGARAYRQEAPVLWCPECRTAIAQAEVDDLERESELITLAFQREDGSTLPIATTRPELLPACVAVFVHPDDARYAGLLGQSVRTPVVPLTVPVLADPRAQPEKGTGAVMCCTFGDSTDIEWWYTHHLPLRVVIDEAGRLSGAGGSLAGLPVGEARRQMIDQLDHAGKLLERRPIEQTVGVHERCGTPVEYLVTRQWFIRVLDRREELLQAGERIRWFPAHMKTRYQEWVQNLRWDWLVSRQRFYGVPFPVWYCSCGEVLVADEEELPVDPATDCPPPCSRCGGAEARPETDVMDTWATSSLSPQIVGQRLTDPALYATVFPMSLRPQAHEIIRTWAFYTIVQSLYHFGELPWQDVAISGWGLAPQGSGKISKSRGGGPLAPMETLRRFSADAARYWAASTGLGKDSIISEEKMQAGEKLVRKLWSVASFGRTFLEAPIPELPIDDLTSGDRWILAALQELIEHVGRAFEEYDYVSAKNDTEIFFWRDLCDNYLEMAKRRLYDAASPGHEAARFSLHAVLSTVLRLFAPILPYATDEIYSRLLEPGRTIHRAAWPQPEARLRDEGAVRNGQVLVDIATAVRRFKSMHALSLGAPLARLDIGCEDRELRAWLRNGIDDMLSVTRAHDVRLCADPPEQAEPIGDRLGLSMAIRV